MRLPAARRLIWRIIRLLLITYVALCLLVFFAQRHLLYHPTRISLADATRTAVSQGFEPWRNQRGDYIGWKRTSPSKAPHAQLLIIHGNSGCALDRLNYADPLNAVLPVDVFMLEYPGYGARTGSPSQASLLIAADDALASLPTAGPTYIMGESLGTGITAYLAGKHPTNVAGLVLLAPYHNLADVAASHFPFLPVHWLLLDRFPAASYLANYHGPIAVLLAGRDEVIPNQFGHRLFDSYAGPKKLWIDPDAAHNDLPDQPSAFWRDLVTFWTAKN